MLACRAEAVSPVVSSGRGFGMTQDLSDSATCNVTDLELISDFPNSTMKKPSQFCFVFPEIFPALIGKVTRGSMSCKHTKQTPTEAIVLILGTFL